MQDIHPASGLDIYLVCDNNDIGHVVISSRPLRKKLFTAEFIEGYGQDLTGAPPVFSAAAVQVRAGLFRFHTPKAPPGGFASTVDRADPDRRRQTCGPIVLITVRSVVRLLPLEIFEIASLWVSNDRLLFVPRH